MSYSDHQQQQNNKNTNSSHPHQQLRIVSWNVAGWTSTANIIRSIYDGKISAFLNNFSPSSLSSSSTDNVCSNSSKPVDVFALQEVKGTGGIKRLKQDPVQCGASDGSKSGLTIPGWETFWANSDPKFRGFNGVAIFARTGIVIGADPAPLRVPELDAEGRCMLAVTAGCCIFSVYAPTASGAGRRKHRKKFYAALGDAVERVRREYGRPVVLCGDLNATYRPSDCHWTWRRFSLEKLKNDSLNWPVWLPTEMRKGMIREIEEVAVKKEEEREKERRKKQELEEQQQKHQQKSNNGNKRNPSGENSFPRTLPANETTITTRNNVVNDDDEMNQLNPDETQEEGVGEEDQDQDLIFDKDEYWWISDLCAASDTTSAKSRKWYPLSQLCYSSDPEVRSVIKHTHLDGRKYLCDLMFDKLGLVDSLVETFPDEMENKMLFTCYNQSVNERYSGIGQRIDYVLVDPEVLIIKKKDNKNDDGSVKNDENGETNTFTRTNTNEEDSSFCPRDEFHSIHSGGGTSWFRQVTAATLGGKFKPAPQDASGMEKLTKVLCDEAFQKSVLPSSSSSSSSAGVIYTAPQLSDHVAVFCDVWNVIDTSKISSEKQQEIDKNISELQNGPTKVCKYVPTTRTIDSFFQKKPKTVSAPPSSASSLPQRRERPEQQQQQQQKRKASPEVIELD